MGNSRTANSIRNVSTAAVGQVLNIVLNFVCRTIFIYTLGKTYLGVNGLFSNILTIMSLAELGIGDAIAYKLYKPVAEGDITKVKAYMRFYRNAYAVIGVVVLSLGLALIPFLQYLIKGGEGIENIKVIYLLYLMNTVSTYFFAYKKVIIHTHQKGYIDTINRYVFLTVQNVVQILILVLFKNFLLYLGAQIVLNLLANMNISRVADKMYPYIRENSDKLSAEELKDVFKQTSALAMHKLGSVVVSGTDNLLLSSFVGITWVGIYSNYVTIVSIPQTLMAYIFSPLTASVGNLVNTSSKEHIKRTFDKLFFLDFWLYGFCAVSLFVLLNPFIEKIWINESYLLSLAIVFFIVVNFYITGMRQVVSSFKSTSGLFWNDRFRPFAEAIVNLGSSILLLKLYGFIGVVIGTTVASLTTTVWVEAKIVFNSVFDGKLTDFLKIYIKYFGCTLLAGVITYYVCSFIQVYGLLSFLARAIVCVVTVNLIFLAMYSKTDVFKEVCNTYLRQIIVKIRRKK